MQMAAARNPTVHFPIRNSSTPTPVDTIMSCYQCQYISGHDPACPDQLQQDHSDLESLQIEVRRLRDEIDVLREAIEELQDWKDSHQNEHAADVYDKIVRG